MCYDMLTQKVGYSVAILYLDLSCGGISDQHYTEIKKEWFMSLPEQ